MGQRQDGHWIWRVERGDTLWGIVRKSFRLEKNADIQKKISEILKINPHIKNANYIHSGQIIYLGPESSYAAANVSEAELSELQSLLQEPSRENAFLLDNWDEMMCLQDEFTFSPQGKLIEPSEEGHVPWKDLYKVLKSSQKTAKDIAKGKLGPFAKYTAFDWQKVEGEVIRDFKNRIKGVELKNGATRLVPKDVRVFPVGNGKVVLVKPDSKGFTSLSKNVRLGKELSKKIIEPAGKIFKIIDLGNYLYAAKEALQSETPGRNFTKETAKYGVGLATGGAVAGGTAAVCGALGLAGGWPGVACFFTVYVGSSFGISWLTEKTSDRVVDRIEETTENLKQFQWKLIYSGKFGYPVF